MSFVYMLLISCVRSKSRMEKPIFIYRLCCLDCVCSLVYDDDDDLIANDSMFEVIGDSILAVCTSSADRCVRVDTTRWSSSSVSTVSAKYDDDDMICCNDVYVAHIMCSVVRVE